MIRRTILSVVCALSLWGGPASAQVPQAPAEPASPAPAQLGPVSVRPSFTLREVGYDSNVFHRPDGGQEGDFTATFGAKVDLGIRGPRVRGTYTGFYEYAYFQEFVAERGSNRGAEGRVDVLLGRLRPYASAGVSLSHERPSAEIDERALRRLASVEAGTSFAASGRTSVYAGYRRLATDFDDDERFRGVKLADELNGTSGAVTAGAAFELSPLTTVSVHGERAEERFEVATDRDANSYRYGATATLHPLALIAGRASVGVRAFRPVTGAIRDFTGITAAIDVSYALQEETRIGLSIDRDLRYSYAEETPYFVSTGGRLTLTHRLTGHFDGQVSGGAERIAYQPRIEAARLDAETDGVRTIGAGVGYRLGDGSRVALNIDRVARTSPAAEREYSRYRVYTTVNYGF
jgi:hypothetical protein